MKKTISIILTLTVVMALLAGCAGKPATSQPAGGQDQTAEENNIPFHAIHIESREDAQNAPTPVTNYALFHDGDYITNEQMNDKKFLKLVNS